MIEKYNDICSGRWCGIALSREWRLWSVPDQIAGVKSMCLAVVSTRNHLATMDFDDIRSEEERGDRDRLELRMNAKVEEGCETD